MLDVRDVGLRFVEERLRNLQERRIRITVLQRVCPSEGVVNPRNLNSGLDVSPHFVSGLDGSASQVRTNTSSECRDEMHARDVRVDSRATESLWRERVDDEEDPASAGLHSTHFEKLPALPN